MAAVTSPARTCNVYLALAAQLMAGLDGVRRKIDPSQAGFGPVDGNIFDWTAEQRRTIRSLPTSLSEACAALESDHEFLLEGDVFNRDQLLDYITHLRADDAEVRNRPHPYEVGKYFDA